MDQFRLPGVVWGNNVLVIPSKSRVEYAGAMQPLALNPPNTNCVAKMAWPQSSCSVCARFRAAGDRLDFLRYNRPYFMRPLLFIAFLITGTFTAMSQTNEPPKHSPAEIMREMRLKQLTMAPSEFGGKPTTEFPRVCAVIMDWPLEAQTVTAVARATGDASIYTTGTFGVIGGIGHETVRIAAMDCVKVAERYYDEATPTKEYPYPASSRVRFYLVCHDGVRVIDADLNAVKRSGANYSDLYMAAQRVITELRMITQQRKVQTL